ncbi:MAG: TraM recognition domain-containing protein [Phaeodactylibacter sp.]|nr:TraM recognition domain-containing protein [Phaeodactylibacter sp.]
MKTATKRMVDLDRVILNWSGDNHPLNNWSVRDSLTGTLVTGQPGTGKTSVVGRILASRLMDPRGLKPWEVPTLIVFLYKKEDSEFWYRLAYECGREQDLIVVSDTQQQGVFNLLRLYEGQEAINAVNALNNVSALSVNGAGKQGEAYWEVEKRKRLHRLVLLNQLSGEPLNITTLYKLDVSAPNDYEQLSSEDFRKDSYCWKMLAQAADRVGQHHPDFVLVENYFVREFPYLADRTSSSIKSLTSSILEPFLSSKMLSTLFCQDDGHLKLEELWQGKILLLDIPVQTHEFAGRVGQTMMKYVLQKKLESRSLEDYPNPCYLWIDEFHNYLAPYDSNWLSVCRSSNASAFLFTQSIANLHAAIGGSDSRQSEARVNSLLSLVGTRIHLANSCFTTNEWASKAIGQKLRNMGSVSIGDNSSSASSQKQLLGQVFPQEFTQLAIGGPQSDWLVEAIISKSGTFSTGANFYRTSFLQPFAPQRR